MKSILANLFMFVFFTTLMQVNLYAAGPIKLQGEIKVSIIDDFKNKRESRKAFVINENSKKSYDLNLKEEQIRKLRSGMRVRVSGILKADNTVDASEVLYLDPSGQITVNPNSYSFTPAPVIGEQKTLFILSKLNDTITPIVTRDDFKLKVADMADQFIRQNSYGQAWLNPDVTTWYSLGLSSYSQLNGNVEGCVTHLSTQLAASGYDLSKYKKIVCVMWGQGTGGGVAYFPGIYSRIGMDNNQFDRLRAVAIHEIGHGFGLDHAAAIHCHGEQGFCEVSSVQDMTDVMSYTGDGGYYSDFNSHRLGWFNTPTGSNYIKAITASGVYTINSYTSALASPEVLKISLGNAGEPKRNYFISYRNATGFDTYLATFYLKYETAPVLHLGLDNENASHLLTTGRRPRPNFGPKNIPTSDFDINKDTYPTLEPGRVYRDYQYDVSIRTISVSNGQAQIEVLFGSTYPDRPTLTLDASFKDINLVAANSTVAVSAQAMASGGASVASVDFMTVDDYGKRTLVCQDLMAPYSCSLPTPNSVANYINYEIVAKDSLGQRSLSKFLRFTIDNVVPTCTVLNYTNGQVVAAGSYLVFSIHCPDNSSSYINGSYYTRVLGTEAYVNGMLISSGGNFTNTTISSGSPHRFEWMIPTSVVNGTLNFDIRIWDQGGNIGKVALSLVVGSGGPVIFEKPQVGINMSVTSMTSNSVAYISPTILNPAPESSGVPMAYPAIPVVNGTPFDDDQSTVGSSAKMLVLGKMGEQISLHASSWFTYSKIVGQTSSPVTYVVGQSPCIYATPNFTLVSGGSSTGVLAGTTQIYTATLTNNDSAACAASTFNISSILPSGFTSQLSSPSITLAPGTTSPIFSWYVTSSTSLSAGSYAIQMNVKNSSNSIFGNSLQTTYVIKSSRTKPGRAK